MQLWRALVAVGIAACRFSNPNGAAFGDASGLAANGASCTAGPACSSAFCVDGVCCDSACGGPCMSCLGSATGHGDGACLPALAGTDPDNDCPTDEPTSCGYTGDCSGDGACAYYGAGTPCSEAMCSGSIATPAATCDGAGTCAQPMNQDCMGFACSMGVCQTSCASDSDCVAGSYCAGSTCAAKLPNGGACGSADECVTGECVDSVCCDTACDGTCEACSAARKGSGGDGTCGPIARGNDPDGECADQGAASCGTDGACDGAGACERYAAGTLCAGSACSDDTFISARQCDGLGACAVGATQPCEPYNCTFAGCITSCGSDGDCATGNYCNNGTCTAQLAQGSTCTQSDECATGFCVDGVCCDSACDDVCEACSAAGSCVAASAGASCGSATCGGPFSETATTHTCDGMGSGSAHCSTMTMECGLSRCEPGTGCAGPPRPAR